HRQPLSVSMPPPPSRSPLFPYTTLFRSRDLIERLDDLASLDPIPTAVIADVVRQNVMTKHSVVQADERESGLRMILNFGHTAGQDRKSTRLNSSHVKSSYAVFCLKKKRE